MCPGATPQPMEEVREEVEEEEDIEYEEGFEVKIFAWKLS